MGGGGGGGGGGGERERERNCSFLSKAQQEREAKIQFFIYEGNR